MANSHGGGSLGTFHRLYAALDSVPAAAEFGEQLAGLKQETEEERTYARILLGRAVEADAAVFQMVLNVMSKDVILPPAMAAFCALQYALEAGTRATVLAVVERMRGETSYSLNPSVLRSLFNSQHFDDQETVDAVISVVPPATYETVHGRTDALDYALHCRTSSRERAVELVLRHGSQMEERLRHLPPNRRFRYVCVAATSSSLAIVRKIHDSMPLLADGSGRRGEVGDYGRAMACACRNKMRETNVAAMMEYLVEQGGSGVLDNCSPSTLMDVPTKKDAEWLLERAPHLLQAACEMSECLESLLFRDASQYLRRQIVKFVDRELIVALMHQPVDKYVGKGWRRELEELHRAVPECLDGLRWPWLMDAIRLEDYDDVAYMIGLCTREHMVMRNEEGDTPYDVAARDKSFPRDLLCRLEVASKGAHMW